MKKFIILFLSILLSGACSINRHSLNILYFSKDTTDLQFIRLKDASLKNGWKIILANDELYFQDDSLSKMDAVFLSFSAINQLGYRSIPSLKRYLETGRGGLITIRDTI